MKVDDGGTYTNMRCDTHKRIIDGNVLLKSARCTHLWLISWYVLLAESGVFYIDFDLFILCMSQIPWHSLLFLALPVSQRLTISFFSWCFDACYFLESVKNPIWQIYVSFSKANWKRKYPQNMSTKNGAIKTVLATLNKYTHTHTDGRVIWRRLASERNRQSRELKER